MRFRVLRSLALVGLLVQAVFGTLAPAAVLCFSAHTHDDQAIVDSDDCRRTVCCTTTKSESGATRAGRHLPIEVTPPCEEGCGGCVDVTLPNVTMLSGSRADLAIDTHAASPLPAALVEPLMLDEFIWRSLPGRVEPPERNGCPHAPVLRTTRLIL